MMRSMLVIFVSLLITSCSQVPVKEAAQVRGNQDDAVRKLREGWENEIASNYDYKSGRVWTIWRTTVDQAKALDKTGAGLVPAEFLEKVTELRDEKLARLKAERITKIEFAQGNHGNYLSSSASMYDAWDQQGKDMSGVIQSLREGAAGLGDIYKEYRTNKTLAAEAKEKAAEAAKGE